MLAGDGRELDTTPAEVEELRAERDQWRERALAAERWRDEAWGPLQRRLADAERLEALAERTEQVEGSASWRLTAPLRLALVAWRRLRAKLRRA
ncbi:MAG TPA: hypothetical protein VGI67_20580 [Thermoleophilaceae bacterium]|jgi:hypothetical protein